MGESLVPDPEAEAALQAAVLFILESEGAEALTADRIAERVGISAGEVELRFPDTTACLTSTYDAVAASIIGEMAAVVTSAEGSGSAALRRMLQALVQRMDRHPGEARLFLLEILRAGREGARHHQAAQRRIVDCVRGELTRRMPDTVIAPLQVELLVGAVYEGLSRCVARPRPGGMLAAEDELLARAHAINPLLA